ncbi:MAG: S16 family serine protease [Halobacteriota archaeon]|nr:S16 family serine protease [Halobacteriota archaeon]
MTGKLKILITSLLTLLLINSVSTGIFYKTMNEEIKEVDNLTYTNSQLIEELKIYKEGIGDLASQIDEKASEIERLSFRRSAEYFIVGIDDSNDSENTGEIIMLRVVIKNGDGGVFTNITGISFERDIQESINTAISVAKNVTGEDLTGRDVMVTLVLLRSQENKIRNTKISGKSAGAAICFATISAINNKSIPDDVFITGTMKEDGEIGTVSGVKEKAEVARDFGAKILLVPKGRRVSVEGIEVIEVENIYEAQNHLF